MLLGTYGAEAAESIVDGVHSMYGGEVQVKFDPAVHRYVVRDLKFGSDWFTVPSVTKILGRMLDKSKPLVSWATRQAKEEFVKRVQPEQAYTADQLSSIGADLEYAHKATLDRAGRKGKDAHDWIEAYLNARAGRCAFPAPPADEKVRASCSRARQWISEVDLKPVAIEQILYSRSQRFIGTTDISAFVIKGSPAIVDWKTSRTLHASYELQLAAYAFMWTEMSGQIVDDRWLIHIPGDGSFETRQVRVETMEDHIESFLLLAAAHNILDKTGFFSAQ